MEQCLWCGKSIKKEWTFCPWCGIQSKPIDPDAVATMAPSKPHFVQSRTLPNPPKRKR